MKGDVRIILSVRIVGEKEPLIAIDSESDRADPCLRIARIALDTAERKLAALGVSSPHAAPTGDGDA